MSIKQKSFELESFTNVLNWIGEHPGLWYQAFDSNGFDNLSYLDLVDLITNLIEEKQYMPLLTTITVHKYSEKLDDVLSKTMCEMIADNIQERDIQEFGKSIVEGLRWRNERKRS